MNDNELRLFLQGLNRRRKELRMSLEVVVKKTHLPRATVCRLLRGDLRAANLSRVAKLAKVLGVVLEFTPVPVPDFVRSQAEQKARELVSMVQGTMALESQGLEKDVLDQMVRDSTERLLSRPRKELWVD